MKKGLHTPQLQFSVIAKKHFFVGEHLTLFEWDLDPTNRESLKVMHFINYLKIFNLVMRTVTAIICNINITNITLLERNSILKVSLTLMSQKM